MAYTRNANRIKKVMCLYHLAMVLTSIIQKLGKRCGHFSYKLFFVVELARKKISKITKCY